ncbi:unnamed protein product, partial [Prorocentrum cordatum]
VAMLQPTCEVGTGLLMMSAAVDNDPVAQKLVKEGVLYEVLGPDVMLGEKNCSIMARAINRPQAFSMRMSELEAMKVLSTEIKNAKEDGSDAIAHENAMQAAGARLGSFPSDPPFCDFINFILSLGADGGPRIRELIDFVETRVNSATRMSRLPAIGLAGEVSTQFPRVKVAVVMRPYRLPPKKASKQTGAPGWCIEPEGAQQPTLGPQLRLMEGVPHARHAALRADIATSLVATFQAQEDWSWLDFATLPPEEKTTAASVQEKGGGAAAQPAAAARDMGKKEAYMGAVLHVLREKHLQNEVLDASSHSDKVHVAVWAKSPDEPVKISFYIHPEFTAPESMAPYDAGQTGPAQREWKWAGKEPTHPFWSVTKLTAEELGTRNVAEAAAGRARFNVELAPKEVNVVICGRVICVRVPVTTNAVDLLAGEELIMEDTHVKRKKEAAPTDWRTAAKKAITKAKSQPQQRKTVFDENGRQDI